MGKMLNVKTAAERLGLSDKTVYALIAGGDLPGYKMRSAVRVDEDELEEYKRACRVRPPMPKAEQARPARRRQRKREDDALGEVYTGLSCLERFKNK